MANVAKVVEEKAGMTAPVFLIEREGKFYLTLAVWEYDDSERDRLSEEQVRGVERVRNLHADGCKGGYLKAIEVEAEVGGFAQHTDPSHP